MESIVTEILALNSQISNNTGTRFCCCPCWPTIFHSVEWENQDGVGYRQILREVKLDIETMRKVEECVK